MPSADTVPAGLRVVVLTHGAGANAPRLVARVLEEGVPARSIAVVHNPTKPDGRPPAMPDPEVVVLGNERNLGYTGGMNRGLRHHLTDEGTRLILLLTHDVRFARGAIGALTDAAARHGEFATLGPALFDPSRGVMFSYGARINRWGAAPHVVEPPADEVDGIVPCDSVDGAFMLMRADVLRRIGIFDDRLFIYAEETELSLRAREAGYRIGVVRAARAEQQVGMPSRPGAYAYLMTRNGLNLAFKARGPIGLIGGAARLLRDVAVYGRRVVDPRRPPAERAMASAYVQGTLRGALAYVRRQWGPPPDTLAGLGDARGA